MREFSWRHVKQYTRNNTLKELKVEFQCRTQQLVCGASTNAKPALIHVSMPQIFLKRTKVPECNFLFVCF